MDHNHPIVWICLVLSFPLWGSMILGALNFIALVNVAFWLCVFTKEPFPKWFQKWSEASTPVRARRMH